MVHKLFNLLLLVAICILFPACNWPLGRNPSLVDQDVINTVVAQTVQASGGEAAVTTNTPEAGLPATDTPQPGVIEVTETLTPTITVTITSSVPMIHSTMDTNCRYGPGVVYAVVGYLLTTDAPVEVRGRLEAGGWWYIQNPRNPTQSCWVWDDTTVVEGNTSDLPFITPPPTPTMTPLPITPTTTSTTTSTPQPRVSAWADPANYAGACPITVTFYATIVVADSISLTYFWESSGGGLYGPYTQGFAGAGDVTLNYRYPFGSDTNGWFVFHITSPVDITSNRATFTVNCLP